MASHVQATLTIGEVDSLLADFRCLATPPGLSLPQRDEGLWRQAIDEAWKAEQKHAEQTAQAVSLGNNGESDVVMANFKHRQAFRAAMEKKTGKPSTAGLCDRFRDMPEQVYRRLDPVYAQAEAQARRKMADDVAAVRKRMDLLLVSVKTPLLQWSELAASNNAVQAWSTYQAAVHQSKPNALVAVIQDLERVKAKMERQAQIAAGELDGEEDAQDMALPERAKTAYDQYLRALPECTGKDGRAPTDRQCHDWLKAHNDGDPLPAFDTWQRYVRQTRRCYGQQKNTPRAGRPHGRSIVSSKDIELPGTDEAD